MAGGCLAFEPCSRPCLRASQRRLLFIVSDSRLRPIRTAELEDRAETRYLTRAGHWHRCICMLLRVECGKDGGHRNAMLPKDLLHLLRAWWKKARDQDGCQGAAAPHPCPRSAPRRIRTRSPHRRSGGPASVGPMLWWPHDHRRDLRALAATTGPAFSGSADSGTSVMTRQDLTVITPAKPDLRG